MAKWLGAFGCGKAGEHTVRTRLQRVKGKLMTRPSDNLPYASARSPTARNGPLMPIVAHLSNRVVGSVKQPAKAAAFLLLTHVSAVAAQGQQCPILELAPVAGNSSVAYAASADGNVVVGQSRDGRAFRWSVDGGFSELTTGAGLLSVARAVNADGNVIVGQMSVPGSSPSKGFRWTSAGGLEDLFRNGLFSDLTGVSADGNVLVGFVAAPESQLRAVRWSGGAQELGNIGATSLAYGVSADANIVVGMFTVPPFNNEPTQRAFRWTAADGMTPLAPGFATAISADGSTVVGYTVGGPVGPVAFRWTQASGIQPLGTLGGSTSYAYGVSGDGSVIVGESYNSLSQQRAFRWTVAGMEDLGSSGGTGSVAYGVSADGSVVVGKSVNGAAVWRFSTPPAITEFPTAVNTCRTTVATFSISATATRPIIYRWRKAGVPIDIASNPSAATDTLRLVRVQPSDAGLYDCIVSTDCGSVTSGAARLTVRTCICLEADIAGGGDAGNEPDGTVDGTDFIAFINSFAIGDAAIDPAADISGGGDPGLEPDGTIDGTDFIFFNNACSIGC